MLAECRDVTKCHKMSQIVTDCHEMSRIGYFLFEIGVIYL